jgi:hypothetical protein
MRPRHLGFLKVGHGRTDCPDYLLSFSPLHYSLGTDTPHGLSAHGTPSRFGLPATKARRWARDGLNQTMS